MELGGNGGATAVSLVAGAEPSEIGTEIAVLEQVGDYQLLISAVAPSLVRSGRWHFGEPGSLGCCVWGGI